MKRPVYRIFISAVLLMLASGSIADIFARGRDFEFWQGSEIRLTWGAAPFDAVTLNHGLDVDYGFYGYGTIAGEIADSRYYGGDGYLSGAVGLTYKSDRSHVVLVSQGVGSSHCLLRPLGLRLLYFFCFLLVS